MADSNSPYLLSSEKTVTTSGNAVALASARMITSVTIIAKAGNTGKVYVGGSDVATTTNDGLAAEDSLSIEMDHAFDLADIYLDADTNGEGVEIYALKA